MARRSEAAALTVLKKDLEAKGITWKDMPVAGGLAWRDVSGGQIRIGDRTIFEALSRSPYGMLMCAGPTGSGKTRMGACPRGLRRGDVLPGGSVVKVARKPAR